MNRFSLANALAATALAAIIVMNQPLRAERLRQAIPLAEQLRSIDSRFLAADIRRRGDASRGALVFFKSAANCVGCHSSGDEQSPLGPNLASLGTQLTDEYLLDALLHPSKNIRQGFETHSVVLDSGSVLVGLLATQDDATVTLRLMSDLEQQVVLRRDEIEAMRTNDKSMMPDGLITSLKTQREFYDLARYVFEVAKGGMARAKELRPSVDALAVTDDSANLDHAGIIKKLKKSDFEAGQTIFQNDCFNCHGLDGDTPSLVTARAFGTQKLKFGSDPYRMFMTLTKGNGLMAPMSYLTPHQRYQVVHYIREQFMKNRNSDYFIINEKYLESLPTGTEDGKQIKIVERDYGPALVSQLRRELPSVLSIKLGELTIAYDLHTMNVADVWTGGFLDLSETQHQRPRGEGTANPAGESVPGLGVWKWGHDGSLDYSRDGLLPRGPLPEKWFEYHGYTLDGTELELAYAIDGREVRERVIGLGTDAVIHRLDIGPGDELLLCAGLDESTPVRSVEQSKGENPSIENTPPANPRTFISGDTEGIQRDRDVQQRDTLRIPADTIKRTVDVVCSTGKRSIESADLRLSASDEQLSASDKHLLWPEVLETVGYRGLEQSGYALDTLTIPESTPGNAWLRASALDFFPDGRMALATYGGDIWIVSGIDNDLLRLQWKRFAAGLYEPFGVKVVDEKVVVTCKDRLVRLHDRDANGEADYYESLSADTDVSTNFHAFNFDLQTDDEGNFYYAKSGHGADYALPGAVIRVSPDGKSREVVCTGFRSPNGLGSMPGGRITVSDNQGQWIPASKICLVKPNAFYGWSPTYSQPGRWAPDGGRIDPDKVKAPDSFEQPLVWMPQEFDNSSGGQVWADDPRFGPLSGHLLHTSFGKGWMSYLMLQEVGDTAQAAIVKLPFDFASGIMRARVNPADGQVYACGLQGWNGGGRPGLEDKCVQRLRYTGISPHMLTDAQVKHDGLELKFNFELEPSSASDVASYVGRQWNYHWSRNYGSDQYAPSTDKPGTEPLSIASVKISPDRRGVRLIVPQIQPVNQLQLLLRLGATDGSVFEEEIYWTINRVPK